MNKNLGQMVAELYKDHKDAYFPLVMDQSKLLQEQYRRDYGIYTTDEGRLRQETFAYLIIKKNLERGLYRK